jgi:hypothetical protein
MHAVLTRRARRLALGLAATSAASLALAGGALADGATGTFVIGNQNIALGTQVTFWGAQWWQENPLSTGLAPAAFKGYADTGAATCGQPWSTAPGDSSFPPAELSGTVPVIVSGQIDQNGDVISGDTEAIALLSVDPGYADDPGHPGTGTVVGYLCGGPLPPIS